MPRYLIDKQGKVWDPYDDRLLAELGDADPDYDILAFAVRNLGAIDVEVGMIDTTLRFRWLTVNRHALEAAAQLLAELRPEQITVSTLADQWMEHRFDTIEAAVSWMQNGAQAALARSAQTRHFIVSPRPLDSIANRPLSRLDEPEDHFSFLFKKWRLSQGRFTPEITESLVRFGDLDRAVVARERSDGKLVFEHVGNRITLYSRADDSWTFRFSGRPVADQPDAEYGRYTEKTFRQVIEQRQPKFDNIDAVVHDGRGATRFRYDRLLLPWQLSSTERLLTSLSFKTSPDALTEA